MNRYSIFIKVGNRVKEIYEFTVLAEDTKEYVVSVISESQKELKYKSPIDLMNYVCDTYGWKWEDFTPDFEFDM